MPASELWTPPTWFKQGDHVTWAKETIGEAKSDMAMGISIVEGDTFAVSSIDAKTGMVKVNLPNGSQIDIPIRYLKQTPELGRKDQDAA